MKVSDSRKGLTEELEPSAKKAFLCSHFLQVISALAHLLIACPEPGFVNGPPGDARNGRILELLPDG